MRTLKFAVALLVAIVIGVLAVANSADITVRLWPDLSDYGVAHAPEIALPLFAFGLLCGLVGFLLGAAREWMREGRVRGEGRKARREAAQLQMKVERLSDDTDDDLPALSAR
ncbi:LapA family protein [Pikeienuella piscinae]|uniref:LapA family protein n=1 Tax=Pikeienuella piscinae TaxID=2748098 RepID=A0A7L5BZ43_9RHOB|nr:LapA family protein [Pikeienuella piscinae]QIE55787.1 LapA family protein [Pikeienuella piscinae]